jgi:hypothetical protein
MRTCFFLYFELIKALCWNFRLHYSILFNEWYNEWTFLFESERWSLLGYNCTEVGADIVNSLMDSNKNLLTIPDKKKYKKLVFSREISSFPNWTSLVPNNVCESVACWSIVDCLQLCSRIWWHRQHWPGCMVYLIFKFETNLN